MPLHWRFRLLAAFSMLAAVTTPVSADAFDSVREFIRSELVKRGVPSLAVAAVKDGKILWEEGFGWADRERRIVSDPHVMYSLASVSKPITATGLMVLKERGKIGLDRPINDYLGEAKIKTRVGSGTATVRQVASHIAGLPLHYHFFPVDSEVRKPPMDETIRRYGNLFTPPGERYQYSNLGYGILDYVIARTSAKSYADFMREEVFLPLGMNRTSIDIGPGLEPYAAARYEPNGKRLPFYDFDHPGGSAVYASAHDLARFALFHLKLRLPDQKTILPHSAIDEMQLKWNPPDASSYGIGWSIEELGPYRLVSHGGGMMGVATLLALIPSERVAVIALCNARDSLAGDVAGRIMDILRPGFMEKRREFDRRQSRPGPPQAFKLSSELIGEWKGAVSTYAGDVPVTLRIKESGDVHVRFGSQLWSLLNDATFQDGMLRGRCLGDLGTDDANRRPYDVRLELTLRGEVLSGAAITLSRPFVQFPSALSHWIELKKESRK